MDDLNTRSGLSDALRVLLDKHPRAEWPQNQRFWGLSAFWLDRHQMFRDLLARMQADLETALDDSMDGRELALRIRQRAGLFINELHGHHTIEDRHYFPLLAQREPRLNKGFDLLDHDHHALDAMLAAFTQASNSALEGLVRPAGRDGLHRVAGDQLTAMARLASPLERHLIDEEDLIVPLLLEYGDPA